MLSRGPAWLSPREKATARHGAWYLNVKVQRPLSPSHSLAVLSEETVSSVRESTAAAAPRQASLPLQLLLLLHTSCLLPWHAASTAVCSSEALTGTAHQQSCMQASWRPMPECTHAPRLVSKDEAAHS